MITTVIVNQTRLHHTRAPMSLLKMTHKYLRNQSTPFHLTNYLTRGARIQQVVPRLIKGHPGLKIDHCQRGSRSSYEIAMRMINF